jgi:hypothetical protein
MQVGERIKIEMVFDQKTGELLDVIPLEGKRTELGMVIDAKELQEAGLKRFTHGSYLFGWGSPGCVVYKTSSGYVRVCW